MVGALLACYFPLIGQFSVLSQSDLAARVYHQQDQVHLASRTHFVDLVIHDICSQKIIPYFADLVIHNICSQKIMPYFFDKLSTSIRNFAQWASTFCFSFLNCFRFWVKFLFGKKIFSENFFGWKNFFGAKIWIKFCWMKIF